MRYAVKIKEILKDLKYSQHSESFMVEILESYPSLLKKVSEYIEKGAKEIEIQKTRSVEKPKVFFQKELKKVTLYVYFGWILQNKGNLRMNQIPLFVS